VAAIDGGKKRLGSASETRSPFRARSRRPKRPGLDAVVLHLEVQGLVIHAQESSRLTLVPLCGLKGQADRLSLGLGGSSVGDLPQGGARLSSQPSHHGSSTLATCGPESALERTPIAPGAYGWEGKRVSDLALKGQMPCLRHRNRHDRFPIVDALLHTAGDVMPPGGAGRDASAFRYRARHHRHDPARLCHQGQIVEGGDRSTGSPGGPVHIVGSSIVATEATISDDPAVAAMGRPRAPCSGVGASVVDVHE